jgi:hypothetical protein
MMKNRSFQTKRGFSPPWSTRAEWRAANEAMAAAVGLHNSLAALKDGRNRMEKLFIQEVVRP